ncbi:MAG: SDR family NAD(P)-dependent oxidoreductase, partial [Betaproteobacteria bacterium]
MRDLQGKWALVTGASSGFGVDFSCLLAERGANLVLVARRLQPMEELAIELRRDFGVKVHVESIDLSSPGAGAQLKSRLDGLSIEVQLLINNAGYGMFGE